MVETDPPFWRYAAKFLAALAAAIIGTSATILAAVDDDHITTSEWAAIALGILALLAGPGFVYGIGNAPKSSGPGPVVPADFVGDVHFLRHVDGTVDLVWPKGRGTTWISPATLEGIVKTHNDLTAQLDAARHDGSAAAARAYPPPPPPQRVAADAWTPPDEAGR